MSRQSSVETTTSPLTELWRGPPIREHFASTVPGLAQRALGQVTYVPRELDGTFASGIVVRYTGH